MPNLSVACRTEAKQLSVGLREVGYYSAKEPGGNAVSRTSRVWLYDQIASGTFLLPHRSGCSEWHCLVKAWVGLVGQGLG